MSSFEVITGFWKRRSASRSTAGNREEYFYGKPKIEEPIVINPGDEPLYVFDHGKFARSRRTADVPEGQACFPRFWGHN